MTTFGLYSPFMSTLLYVATTSWYDVRSLFPSDDNISTLFPWNDNIVIWIEMIIPLTWQLSLWGQKFISSKSSACMFFGQFTFLRWFKCITCSSLNDEKMTIETRKNIISIITCTLQCCLFKDVGNGIKYFIHSLHKLMHSTTAPKRLIVAYSFLFSPCCCHFVAVLLAPNDDTALP